MSLAVPLLAATELRAEHIRLRGLVQGVGMRPTIWRLAHAAQLKGWVRNDGEGVEIRVQGAAQAIAGFVRDLRAQLPPLARVDRIERQPCEPQDCTGFEIEHSLSSVVHTGVVADAACCEQCRSEIFNPDARRYRYAFSNCTHCGPRLSIVERIPYDRAGTSMRAFALCADCRAEYEAPQDRRFHAQPMACPACGPRLQWLSAVSAAGGIETSGPCDALDAAVTLLQRGGIVAIKGLGGYQLACDAGNAEAVAELRRRKRRARKPFALMARDLEVIRQYAAVSEAEAALLQSAAAPIVLLDAQGAALPQALAPGLRSLGFMLPNTPLHHLLLERLSRPIVLTSGNLADEPQCIDDEDARARLSGIADCFLQHNRAIVRRVDDSVARVMNGRMQLLRRARGYAPNPLPLPEGFAEAAPLLALGGELKNTFCLLRRGEAIVSHHMGDLGEARTQADYRRAITDYLQLFAHQPEALVMDAHPEYHSSKLAQELAQQQQLPLRRVQHHHAHIAACMADNGVPLNAAPVLGIALDGLGYGERGEIWGGEFLLADYRHCRRLASLQPVAMLGGEKAMHEPWRNTYAQLTASLGWTRFAQDYRELELYRFLETQPRAVLDAMLAQGLNSPVASSCGRLFDAVAAALGICRERALYEGQAAIELETCVDADSLQAAQPGYPFALTAREDGLLGIEPLPMWQALLDDLRAHTALPLMAARFHLGLTQVMVQLVQKLCDDAGPAAGLRCVALSGGVFQNRVLLGETSRRLQALGYTVLQHQQVPANDGGLSLGQAVIAAARQLAAE